MTEYQNEWQLQLFIWNISLLTTKGFNKCNNMFGVLICIYVSDRKITILFNFMRNSETNNEQPC